MADDHLEENDNDKNDLRSKPYSNMDLNHITFSCQEMKFQPGFLNDLIKAMNTPDPITDPPQQFTIRRFHKQKAELSENAKEFKRRIYSLFSHKKQSKTNVQRLYQKIYNQNLGLPSITSKEKRNMAIFYEEKWQYADIILNAMKMMILKDDDIE